MKAVPKTNEKLRMKRQKTDSILMELPISTADGRFVARYSATGLAGLDFPRTEKSPSHHRSNIAEAPRQIQTWHRATTQALERVLAGKAPGQLPPLDVSAGTDFQRSVWAALAKIARGETRSYAQIARDIGKPLAVRAVGGACGANPVPVLVPCHRALAANGKIGGFSGGLDWKKKLLAREGVTAV
jgi:O-6-methylguanine DNA methyltransferase